MVCFLFLQQSALTRCLRYCHITNVSYSSFGMAAATNTRMQSIVNSVKSILRRKYMIMFKIDACMLLQRQLIFFIYKAVGKITHWLDMWHLLPISEMGSKSLTSQPIVSHYLGNKRFCNFTCFSLQARWCTPTSLWIWQEKTWLILVCLKSTCAVCCVT